MASEPSPNVTAPAEPVQRRPSDALWFTVLIASVATGIGMTIFAPVGDDPPPPLASTAPSVPPPTTTLVATQPSTAPSTDPSTAPVP
jgi:hypothetical protein